MKAQDLVIVASIVAVFGAATLPARLQREIHMAGRGEPTWIPWAEGLVLAATLLSLLLVIAPILFLGPDNRTVLRVGRAATLLSVILLAGYVPSILAHYRLICGRARSGSRENPEPAECLFVCATVGIGSALAIASFVGCFAQP